MNRIVPMLMLFVGVALAAAFGARNGASHTDWRSATWLVDQYASVPADGEERAAAIDALQGRGLLEPGEAPEDRRARAEADREALGRPMPLDRVTQWSGVGGIGWLLGVVLITSGALLARRQIAAETRGEGQSDLQRVEFAASLTELREAVDRLAVDMADLPMDDDAPALRSEIDRLLIDVIGPVVDARGRFQARHGIGAFAEYFGPFSGGERYLGRAWSALTDGHAQVAREALTSASEQFAQADDAWRKAEGATNPSGVEAA